mgnify:CR=1 FL=1
MKKLYLLLFISLTLNVDAKTCPKLTIDLKQDVIPNAFIFADTLSKDSLLNLAIHYNDVFKNNTTEKLILTDLLMIVRLFNTFSVNSLFDELHFKEFILVVGKGDSIIHILLHSKLSFNPSRGGGSFSVKYNIEFMGTPNPASMFYISQ